MPADVSPATRDEAERLRKLLGEKKLREMNKEERALVAHAAMAWAQQSAVVATWRETLEEVADALDKSLGDSDLTHIESDEELREVAPVQWACSQISRMLQSQPASTVAAPNGALELAKRIGDILRGALSGDEKRYRSDDGFVRWGLVQNDIGVAIAECYPKPSSSWTACSERKPPDMRPVLIQWFEGDSDGMDVAWFNGMTWFGMTGGVIVSDVTHWMPLPEAPK